MATTKKAAAKKPAATKATATPAVEAVSDNPVPPEVNGVRPGDLKLDDMMHQNWACFAPAHYTQEMVESRKFWIFAAKKMKDMDHVRVTAEDGSWVCWGIMRKTIGGEIVFQVYDWVELQEAPIANEIKINDYVIRHFGPVRQFAVVNSMDGTVVKEGYRTQSDALKYATGLIQANTHLAEQAS